MDVTQPSIVHHISLVLLVLWIFTSMGCGHPLVFLLALLYLYAVNERYSLRLRRRLQHEERKSASQRRMLSDSESVRWLNRAIEKIWPICMEQIASQQFLLAIIPWFLEKYKPWTARKAVVQHLYLGRSPPIVTEIRVLGESSDDDHLALEFGINFLSAHDMSAILEVQLRKLLGLGIRTNLHVTGMHVEGKVLVGVKFLQHWPFLGRVRVCFVEPPYFQMTVKPIFTHGVDVTELPGIAGWLDNLLAVAFEQTLVEPNMLVVDVEKFVSAPEENWFNIDEKPPIAFVKLEILEAADMIPSDMNGLADPYVKGQLGPYRFRTKIQKKTLAPKWLEEFRIPICSWEAPNVLVFEVLDKDHIFDDMMGDCSINISDLRGGQRHKKWLTLHNIKKGRLHLAITVLEGDHEKEKGQPSENEQLSRTADTSSPGSDSVAQNYNGDSSLKENLKVADEFEPISIEGQEKTGIWVHHPGSEVCQTWEPRKGRARRPEIQLRTEDVDGANSLRSVSSVSLPSETSSSSGGIDGSKVRKHGIVKRALHKIGLIFNKSSKNHSARHRIDKVIPRHNLQAVSDRRVSVNLIVDNSCAVGIGDQQAGRESHIIQKSVEESSRKDAVEVLSENIISHSSRKYKTIMSRKMDDLQPEELSDKSVLEYSEKSDLFNSISGENTQLSACSEPIDTPSISFRDQDSFNAKSGSNPCSIGEDKEPNHVKANF